MLTCGQPADEMLEATNWRGLAKFNGCARAMDSHDKNFSERALRTANLSHSVPGILSSTKQQAMIAESFGGGDTLEILEARRRSIVQPATIIENERFSPPSGLPVLKGVKIKNMGTKLTFGVAMR